MKIWIHGIRGEIVIRVSSTVIIVVLIGRNYMFVNLEFHILLKFAKFPKKIVQDKCRKEILLLSWHLISS